MSVDQFGFCKLVLDVSFKKFRKMDIKQGQLNLGRNLKNFDRLYCQTVIHYRNLFRADEGNFGNL